jgi:hypothetical protein
VDESPAVEVRSADAVPGALRSTETPRRGAILGGERVRRVAQWPDDDAIDESVVTMMPSASRASVDELTLPALVSNRPGFASTTMVLPGQRWYAMWSQHEGLTVTLNASGEARVYAHVQPFPGNERVRGTDAFVTQNESIWSVAWIEHGIAYDLNLECESPTMPECQDSAFAMELAEDLVYVGPREAAR